MKPALQPRFLPAEVVAIPLLDQQRRNLDRWILWLDYGRVASVRRAIVRVLPGLRRVHGSRRHEALRGYLDSALVALQTNEPQGARYVLIEALTIFL